MMVFASQFDMEYWYYCYQYLPPSSFEVDISQWHHNTASEGLGTVLVVLVFPEALEEGTIKSNNEPRIWAQNRMEQATINFHGGKMENLPH